MTLEQLRDRLTQADRELITLDVRTIEANGGGSVRCMLAELHLPRKTQPEGTIAAD